MEQQDSGGYIKVHRRLLDHRLWCRGRYTQGQAWVDLLLLASYADHSILMGTKVVQVKRGDVLTSQVKLAARWRWDRETVRRFFRAIESLNMVRIRTSKESETGYTIVSITNYDIYQGDGQQARAAVPGASAPSDPASVPHRCPTINKGKERSGGNAAPTGRHPGRNGNDGETSEYHVAVQSWFELFEAAKGIKPQFDGAEGLTLKRLLAKHELATVQDTMRHLLYHTRLSWITKRHGYSIKTLAGSWNELASEAQARRQAEAVG